MTDRVQDRFILKWHKAMAAAVRHFTKDEHAAGWPASMKPDQLAALQQPYIMGGLEHRPGRWQYEETMKAITGACLAGALPHELTITHTPGKTIGGRISFVNSWDGSQRRFDPPKTQPAKDVTVYRITAPAFAAWLAAQGETPSIHIQAWFDAVGVTAGAERHTTDTDSDSVRWTNELKTEARAMIDRLRGAGNRAFKAETAKHYGVSTTRLSEVLKDDHDKPAKSKPVVNSVFSLGGKTHRIQ